MSVNLHPEISSNDQPETWITASKSCAYSMSCRAIRRGKRSTFPVGTTKTQSMHFATIDHHIVHILNIVYVPYSHDSVKALA
jgi:hypothetical protein